MVRVITIAREYGAGGSPLARLLAGRLGWQIIDDPLIERIAAAAKTSTEAVRCCDEKVDPWFHGILKAIWRGGFEGSLSRTESGPLDSDAVARLWRRVIREAADAGGCVTVGRGGQCILKNRPDVFHVYLYAPAAQRIERIREFEPDAVDLSPTAITEHDRQRSAYIRHYFGEDWRDPHLYNLMLCSSMELERIVDVILLAAGISGTPPG